MSISQEARLSDALALLQLLFKTLEDAPIDCTLIDASDAAYAAVKSTSWDELCSEALLTKKTDSLYMLTAKGWSEALLRAGVSSTPDLGQRIGQLAKSLKYQVKDRRQSVIMPFDEIVQSSGLPSGWVFNVIDSRLISRLHGKRDASWFEGARGRLVEIPRDFGLVEVDLFADIRAENLKLMESVERMEELYGEFRCGTCSAPMISRGTWEHEYGSEEVTEYACGMTIGAPNGDTPCTQSPQFPKFEDFKLTTEHSENEWTCYASAATHPSSADSVLLTRTFGKTEEEARAAMRSRYQERARPWKG